MAWTDDELETVGAAEELDLRSRRADGRLRDPVTMWVVRHGGELYVRAVKGREGWYRGALTRHEGHIRSGAAARDVSFAEADAGQDLNDALDAEYRSKYRDQPAEYVDSVVSARARSSTLRLVPRDTAIDHEPNVNQVRHEPVPASHHEDRRPDAVRRNEEAAAGSAAEEPRPTDADGAGRRDARDEGRQGT